MRPFICLLLSLILLCESSCATHKVIEKERGPVTWRNKDDNGKEVIPFPVHDTPKPGYYCLLPLSVPFDVATSPFQLAIWGVAMISTPGWKD